MDNMQSVNDGFRQSLTEMTIEVVNLRAAVSSNTRASGSLSATANAAWDSQAKRIDELEKDTEDVQGQVRRGSGPNRDEDGSRWNLPYKGELKEYSGDKKTYRACAGKVAAFCNSMKPGFRRC